MMFAVEQKVKSGLGELRWLKVGGDFATRSLAEVAADRLEKRTGQPHRVVEQPA